MKGERTGIGSAEAGLLVLFAIAGLGGCTTKSPSSPPVSSPEGLTVTVVGLPDSTSANVTVSGPGGFNQHVTTTRTLGNLGTGQYAVVAGNVLAANPIVSALFSGRVSHPSINFSAGASVQDSAVYSARPGTGKLWVTTQSPHTIICYEVSQLATSGSPAPTAVLQTTLDHEGLAFDRKGGMWVAAPDNHLILGFTTNQLENSGTPIPAVTISSSKSRFGPNRLAFDPSGDLWASDSDTLIEYTPDQLLSSGSPTPAVSIHCPPNGIMKGLAFDSDGNLWACDFLHYSVLEYTRDQLALSGSPVPAVTIGGPWLMNTLSLAFDSKGDLWVAGSNALDVVMYSQAQLSTSGYPEPAVEIDDDGANSLFGARGPAFDNRGDLWMLGENLIEFSAAQLVSSGAPVPAVTIGAGKDPQCLAFDLPPSNVPIYR